MPSPAGGERGIAVRVLPPSKPRYEAGAPVVVHVAGGVEAGAAVGRPEFIGLGFVEVFFGFPGGREEAEAASGGKYDFRGPDCTRALADTIRFVTGRAADKQGRRIDDLVGNIKILKSNYGLLGSSHGGNACGLVMARHGEEFPDLSWYASMESPYGEGMVPVELGGFESGMNPAYDPKTGALDLGRLAWSDEVSPAGFPRRGPRPLPELKGALYFDINHDGKFLPEDDFPANVFLRDVGGGLKAWYSPRLLREAERRSLFGKTRPTHIPTAAEAEQFWRDREASAGIREAVRKCPNVAVIVYAGERDHVQVAPDHPHILAQAEGFRQAKAPFVRLNPDRAYVERILQSRPMLRAAAGRALADNDAGRAWDRQSIREGLEPAGLPIPLYMQAAVSELADRTQAKHWAANLDAVLYPQAPWEPMMSSPVRPSRAEGGGPRPSRDTGPRPPRPSPGGGPWERDLLIAASEDGTAFAAAETFVEGGGVPSVIKDAKGRLIAAFQHFPANDPAHFDRVAVKVSEDGGKTWSAPQPITVEGLPGTYQRPFDPTLALAADGRIRLYFSCNSAGRRTLDENVATYSAISTDGVRYTFEPGVRFSVPGRAVIDCAVVRLGEKWHYTAPRGRPQEGAYHAVSADGLKFTRVDDIPSVDGENWLGNLLPYGDGMRFYGNSGRGMWWAFSKDGTTWTRPTYMGMQGGDPAAVQVSDKKSLIIYTGEPRRRGLLPGAGPRPLGTDSPPGEFPPGSRVLPPPRGDSPPREGPYAHAVRSASSQDGLTWMRVIIETDAGGDPDDEQSLVRFLLYANEWDVEGIIAARPVAREGENRNPERTGLGIVRAQLKAYGQCYPNLVRHDGRFPTRASLWQRTVAGYDDCQDGVKLIIAAADSPDPRPIWFCNWGTDANSATSSLKRALDQVRRERGQEGYAKFKGRFRLSSADKFGEHTTLLAPPWPLWVDTFRPEVGGRRWYHRFSALTATAGGFDLRRDVLTGHGPLGALYPTNTGLPQKEGDTMTFLYLVPTGLSDQEHPSWGSWAGRYGPQDAFPGKPYYWANQADTWEGRTDRDNTLARWAVHLQNDFRSRLEWCVKDFAQANHPPVVHLQGDATRRPIFAEVPAGQTLTLSGAGTTDPDGGRLVYQWLVHPETGSYAGAVPIEAAASEQCTVRVPADAGGKTIHVILQVTDDGNPPLTRYRRMVIAGR